MKRSLMEKLRFTPERVLFMDDSTTLKYIRTILEVSERNIKKYTDTERVNAVKAAAYESIKEIMKGEKENDV